MLYPVEESRGYEAHGDLWSPGYYKFRVSKGTPASLVASTETFETMTVLDSMQALEAERERRRRLIAQARPAARHGIAAELVLAADQFIITPAGRTEEAARARASGDEVRTVIAGYHWFTDWGRDTMISLEGLTLATGRQSEAGYILRTFSHYVRDGLIPNMFPEGEKEGLYHTADATLWFFHAVARYVACSADVLTLDALYPTLKEIVAAHIRGTQFGIDVDPKDGLLRQGAEGYQLTWMDAKVDGWVVTPRRGKPVEINALWYNALVLMQRWAGQRNDADAATYQAYAAQVQREFNQRFWYPEGGYLYDVIDAEGGGTDGRGNDARCRPNQVLAVALPHPVLLRERWEASRSYRGAAVAHTGRASFAGAGRSRVQGALFRRPPGARRGLPSGDRLGLAGRSLRGCVAEGVPRRSRKAPSRRSTASPLTSTTRASGRSARSSMRTRRSRRAAVLLRPGVSRKC